MKVYESRLLRGVIHALEKKKKRNSFRVMYCDPIATCLNPSLGYVNGDHLGPLSIPSAVKHNTLHGASITTADPQVQEM